MVPRAEGRRRLRCSPRAGRWMYDATGWSPCDGTGLRAAPSRAPPRDRSAVASTEPREIYARRRLRRAPACDVTPESAAIGGAHVVDCRWTLAIRKMCVVRRTCCALQLLELDWLIIARWLSADMSMFASHCVENVQSRLAMLPSS